MDAANLLAEARWVWHRLDEAGIEFGINPARCDGITADAVGPVINRDSACQRMQARFGRAVGRVACIRAQAFDGADVHDTATVSKIGQCLFDQKKRCAKVNGQCSVPVLDRHCLDSRLQHNARVVDQDIELSGVFGDVLNNLAGGVGVGEIGADAVKFRVVLPLRGEHLNALASQIPGTGLSDTAAPTRHQRNLFTVCCHITGFPPLTSSSAPHM